MWGLKGNMKLRKFRDIYNGNESSRYDAINSRRLRIQKKSSTRSPTSEYPGLKLIEEPRDSKIQSQSYGSINKIYKK